MNARVLLLMLVTAGFMAAWDGDQAVMQIAIAKRDEHRRQAIAVMPADTDPSVADQPSQPDLKTVSVTHPTSQDANALPVPLPKGIAAGTYQAVNQAGTSIRVDVQKPNNAAPARDFYVVDKEDGHRWYLIRVTQ